jgi:hypothetical protein
VASVKTHIVGPFWDVQCEACNESIMDGEFADTRAEAKEIAALHVAAHDRDNGRIPEAHRG